MISSKGSGWPFIWDRNWKFQVARSILTYPPRFSGRHSLGRCWVTYKAPGLGGAMEHGLRATARACTAQHHLHPHGRIHLSVTSSSFLFAYPPALPVHFHPQLSDHLFFPRAAFSLSIHQHSGSAPEILTLHILRGVCVCVSSGSATALGSLSVKILVRDSLRGTLRNLGPQPTLSRKLPLQMI